MPDPFAQLWGQRPAPGPLTRNLVDAVIQHESGGNPMALNPRTGAMGLMQIMPDTGRNPGFGVRPLADPWDATENKRFGTDYLGAMLKRYPGDRDAALVAYNWGPGNADKWVKSGKTLPLPEETRNYVSSINAHSGGETNAMPQASLTSAMGGGGSMPRMFGGGDDEGYFSRLFQNPMFLMGTSVLGAGLSGRDAGAALAQGAQAASAASEVSERQRRRASFQKLFASGEGAQEAPILNGIPRELLPVIQAMGPDDGMKMLSQIAMKRMSPQLTEVAPGASLYDPQSRQAVFTAPTAAKESPYAETMQRERAKAAVDLEGRAKVGGQMLGLLEGVRGLAGQDGSPEAQTFEDATGAVQGTGTYQKTKGFFNSSAKTPQIYNDMQQYLGTVRMLAQRAYLSGQGQVTEAERKAVNDAIGAVESAPSREAALRAVNTLESIIQSVFMNKVGADGADVAAPPPGTPPPGGNVVGPGIAVEGGMPATPAAAPPPGPGPAPAGGRPRITDGAGNVMELDESGTKWIPAQPAAPQAPVAPAAPAPQSFGGPSSGGILADQQRLLANPTPEAKAAFDAFYGKGKADALIAQAAKPQPQIRPQGRYGYRAQ